MRPVVDVVVVAAAVGVVGILKLHRRNHAVAPARSNDLVSVVVTRFGVLAVDPAVGSFVEGVEKRTRKIELARVAELQETELLDLIDYCDGVCELG